MDDRLQQLERAFEASGSPEDEAAWLQERVRVGEVSDGRLELAAYCGHVGARTLLGDRAPEEPTGITAWAHGVAERSWPAYQRLLVLCAAFMAADRRARGEAQDLVHAVRNFGAFLLGTSDRVPWLDTTWSAEASVYGEWAAANYAREAVLVGSLRPAEPTGSLHALSLPIRGERTARWVRDTLARATATWALGGPDPAADPFLWERDVVDWPD